MIWTLGRRFRTIAGIAVFAACGLCGRRGGAETFAPSTDFLPFAILDQTSDHSHADAMLAYGIFSHGPDVGMRLDLFGQYWVRGFSGYAALPVSYATDQTGSQATLGNVEIGGTSAQGRWLLRTGVALPTASDGFLVSNSSAYARPSALPSTPLPTLQGSGVSPASTLRLSASPLIERGRTSFRADFGLDVPIGQPGVFLRLGLGLGVHVGRFALTMEMVNVAKVESNTASDGDGGPYRGAFMYTFAGSVRFSAARVRPFVAAVIPMNHVDALVRLYLTGGLELPL